MRDCGILGLSPLLEVWRRLGLAPLGFLDLVCVDPEAPRGEGIAEVALRPDRPVLGIDGVEMRVWPQGTTIAGARCPITG
jgi:hypothetical protein